MSNDSDTMTDFEKALLDKLEELIIAVTNIYYRMQFLEGYQGEH